MSANDPDAPSPRCESTEPGGTPAILDEAPAPAAGLLAPPPSEPKSPVRFQRQLNLFAAAAIVVVALIYLLEHFATVLQQLLVAVFLVYLIMPVYFWLVRDKGLPSWLACVLIVLGVLVSFSALGVLIGDSYRDLERKLPQYEQSLTRMIDETSERLPWLAPETVEWLKRGEGPAVRNSTEWILAALRTLSGFLTEAFVVLVYLIFILAELSGLRRRIDNAFDAKRASQIEEVFARINASITEYVVVKTLMGLLTGALTTAVLLAFGVDYAMLWGIIAFLFNYIPYLGSIVATVFPVALSLVQFENLPQKRWLSWRCCW